MRDPSPPAARSAGPDERRSAPPLADAWRLAWPLAKRDILARYRGSVVGLAWALVAPLAMVLVYSLVFRGVFNARWAGDASGGDGFGYVARLFAGLMMFQAMTEAATRATRLMQDNANLVKRVVFPLERLGTALQMQVTAHLLLQSVLLAVLLMAVGPGARVSWLWLPLAGAWLLALQHVLVLALAALGTYLRDLQHAVPVATTGLLFLSPVFYPVDAAPALLRGVLVLNPLTAPIELARHAWFGDALSPTLLVAHGALLALAWPLAGALFRRLRPGFADMV